MSLLTTFIYHTTCYDYIVENILHQCFTSNFQIASVSINKKEIRINSTNNRKAVFPCLIYCKPYTASLCFLVNDMCLNREKFILEKIHLVNVSDKDLFFTHDIRNFCICVKNYSCIVQQIEVTLIYPTNFSTSITSYDYCLCLPPNPNDCMKWLFKVDVQRVDGKIFRLSKHYNGRKTFDKSDFTSKLIGSYYCLYLVRFSCYISFTLYLTKDHRLPEIIYMSGNSHCHKIANNCSTYNFTIKVYVRNQQNPNYSSLIYKPELFPEEAVHTISNSTYFLAYWPEENCFKVSVLIMQNKGFNVISNITSNYVNIPGFVECDIWEIFLFFRSKIGGRITYLYKINHLGKKRINESDFKFYDNQTHLCISWIAVPCAQEIFYVNVSDRFTETSFSGKGLYYCKGIAPSDLCTLHVFKFIFLEPSNRTYSVMTHFYPGPRRKLNKDEIKQFVNKTTFGLYWPQLEPCDYFKVIIMIYKFGKSTANKTISGNKYIDNTIDICVPLTFMLNFSHYGFKYSINFYFHPPKVLQSNLNLSVNESLLMVNWSYNYCARENYTIVVHNANNKYLFNHTLIGYYYINRTINKCQSYLFNFIFQHKIYNDHIYNFTILYLGKMSPFMTTDDLKSYVQNDSFYITWQKMFCLEKKFQWSLQDLNDTIKYNGSGNILKLEKKYICIDDTFIFIFYNYFYLSKNIVIFKNYLVSSAKFIIDWSQPKIKHIMWNVSVRNHCSIDFYIFHYSSLNITKIIRTPYTNLTLTLEDCELYYFKLFVNKRVILIESSANAIEVNANASYELTQFYFKQNYVKINNNSMPFILAGLSWTKKLKQYHRFCVWIYFKINVFMMKYNIERHQIGEIIINIDSYKVQTKVYPCVNTCATFIMCNYALCNNLNHTVCNIFFAEFVVLKFTLLPIKSSYSQDFVIRGNGSTSIYCHSYDFELLLYDIFTDEKVIIKSKDVSFYARGLKLKTLYKAVGRVYVTGLGSNITSDYSKPEVFFTGPNNITCTYITQPLSDRDKVVNMEWGFDYEMRGSIVDLYVHIFDIDKCVFSQKFHCTNCYPTKNYTILLLYSHYKEIKFYKECEAIEEKRQIFDLQTKRFIINIDKGTNFEGKFIQLLAVTPVKVFLLKNTTIKAKLDQIPVSDTNRWGIISIIIVIIGLFFLILLLLLILRWRFKQDEDFDTRSIWCFAKKPERYASRANVSQVSMPVDKVKTSRLLKHLSDTGSIHPNTEDFDKKIKHKANELNKLKHNDKIRLNDKPRKSKKIKYDRKYIDELNDDLNTENILDDNSIDDLNNYDDQLKQSKTQNPKELSSPSYKAEIKDELQINKTKNITDKNPINDNELQNKTKSIQEKSPDNIEQSKKYTSGKEKNKNLIKKTKN